jgi:hypothetical protein
MSVRAPSKIMTVQNTIYINPKVESIQSSIQLLVMEERFCSSHAVSSNGFLRRLSHFLIMARAESGRVGQP